MCIRDRGEDALAKLALEMLEHGPHHVVLPVREVMVEARLAESRRLAQLRERRPVVAGAPNDEHQLLDHFLTREQGRRHRRNAWHEEDDCTERSNVAGAAPW